MSSRTLSNCHLACAIGALVAAWSAGGSSAAAQSITVTYDGPFLDRWMYPFNPTPGTRITASVFGATNEPLFDDRDGQMILGWRTQDDIPVGLGSSAYQITSARVTVDVAGDLLFIYDDTQDSYRFFLPLDDPEYLEDDTPGQPLELFGTGYRLGFSKFSWQENTAYTFGDPIGQRIRTAYAMSFDANGDPVDVSMSVEDRFDPLPFAIGLTAEVDPGDLVPQGTRFTFDINVTNAHVQQYLRDALDAGILNLTLTSLYRTTDFGTSVPILYCREHPDVTFGFAQAATLELSVSLGSPCPADLDGDGQVNSTDMLALLNSWGPCTGCPADLDGSGIVDSADLLLLLAAWGPCP